MKISPPTHFFPKKEMDQSDNKKLRNNLHQINARTPITECLLKQVIRVYKKYDVALPGFSALWNVLPPCPSGLVTYI